MSKDSINETWIFATTVYLPQTNFITSGKTFTFLLSLYSAIILQKFCGRECKICFCLNILYFTLLLNRTSLVAQTVKHLPAMWEIQVWSLDWEDPLEKEMATHSVLLPGKFHGLRSLVGYSPWGCKESDMTERLHFHFSSKLNSFPVSQNSPCTFLYQLHAC